MPGATSPAPNLAEHPQPAAERIVRLAKLIGREQVIAGTDCGFAQGPFYRRVHPEIMWAKLEALAAGARIASKALWTRRTKTRAMRPAARRAAKRRAGVRR